MNRTCDEPENVSFDSSYLITDHHESISLFFGSS